MKRSSQVSPRRNSSGATSDHNQHLKTDNGVRIACCNLYALRRKMLIGVFHLCSTELSLATQTGRGTFGQTVLIGYPSKDSTPDTISKSKTTPSSAIGSLGRTSRSSSNEMASLRMLLCDRFVLPVLWPSLTGIIYLTRHEKQLRG